MMASPDGQRERGSAAVEAVIGVPALLLVLALLILGGRVATAHQAVQSAASGAARAASIARTTSHARADAETTARDTLSNQGVECVTVGISVDTSGFAAPIGTDADVSVTVSCSIKLGDLGIPGLHGLRTVTETMSSPLDVYRER